INKEKDRERQFDFRKPVDYTLKQLVNDDDFKIHLTNVCKEYKENPKSGRKLHRWTPRRLPPPVELCELDWKPAELAALGVILTYYKILTFLWAKIKKSVISKVL
ncbi:4422_t:CDS:1, partial [Paraglomus brasilianum]